MPEIKENFFENILFRFENNPCSYVKDVTHEIPGAEPSIQYKLQADKTRNILFGYAAKKGLVRIAPNGTIEEANILGKLIALPSKGEKEFKKFLEENGFLFPIASGNYESFDANMIYALMERIRCTVELMTATNEINKDYDKIFAYTLALLFAGPISVETSGMTSAYYSCVHPHANLMNISPSQSHQREQEAFNKDTFTIIDTITGSNEININSFNDINSGYSKMPGHNDPIFRQIVRLYVNFEGNHSQRRLIDFLYHYYTEVGIYNLTIGTYYSEPRIEHFTDDMKKALLEISKEIIGEEINANIKGIHPIYDSDKMSPSWKVDSLISAIYFSIFYLKPELELYRPCDNPRCGNYFLVKTTSTKTRFCSTACCNRVTQDRYRKKKREQAAE